MVKIEIMNLEKAHEILEKAFAEWRKIQTLKREKISVEEFGNFLGYSQQAVNFWLNKDRPIGENAIIKIAPRLAELLGNKIYKDLGLPEPEENLEYIKKNWNEFTPEERVILRKQAEKIIKKKNDR
jgi:transcriptional regulator with XRE-family HTH domain